MLRHCFSGRFASRYAFRLLRGRATNLIEVSRESPKKQLGPKGANERLGPAIDESPTLDEPSRPFDFSKKSQLRKLGHDVPHDSGCHAGHRCDLAIGMRL